MNDSEELNPEKFKKCDKYWLIPGGENVCQLICTLKQAMLCFTKFCKNEMIILILNK